MSEEQYGLLFEGNPSSASDSFFDRSTWRQKEWPFRNSNQFSVRESKRFILSTSLIMYLAAIHIICFLLGVVVLFQIWNKPDLAMLHFDNRFPNWVPVYYELKKEHSLKTPESDFTRLPNNKNRKAREQWDQGFIEDFTGVHRRWTLSHKVQ
ncbi:hypothetical protein HYFRA_00001863 [Hymenoscyphus fraxineus]|uniref:Uncharacterized protein n=1 Tax=Hymenoscyphus fraxineus TaxID=746836 RepID=A0A9N9PNU4_9HELO|nr:hypothetical protein HYFRA_00001863 [Hymenoscyphus fraxineus]